MNHSRTLRFASLATLALILTAVAPARADERGAGTVYDRDTFPYGDRVNQPLTLPATLLRLDVPVVANLSKDHVGEPVFVPLALDVGITRNVQLGVFSSEGLCLSGKSHGCGDVFGDVGGRAMIGLSRTPESQLALEVNLLAAHLADAVYQAAAAVRYKHSMGFVGVTLDLGLASQLNNRANADSTERVFADAEGALQFGERLSAFGIIGINRRLNTAAGHEARFNVPLTVGVEYEPVRKLDVGVEIGFPNLLGEDATIGERQLTILLRLFV